jgi:hypothetical protein
MAPETRVRRDEQTRWQSAWGTLGRRERGLWLFTVGALLGDLVLTQYGLARGLTEGNPLVRHAIELGGLWSHGLLKAAVLAAGLGAWGLLPERQRRVVPLGLGLPWCSAAAINATLLFL